MLICHFSYILIISFAIYRVNSDLDILEVSEESKKGQGKKVFEDSLDELKKLKDEAIKIYGEEYYR